MTVRDLIFPIVRIAAVFILVLGTGRPAVASETAAEASWCDIVCGIALLEYWAEETRTPAQALLFWSGCQVGCELGD